MSKKIILYEKDYQLFPLPGLLSAIVPGLGQILRRQYSKGLLFLAGFFLLSQITIARSEKIAAILHSSMPGDWIAIVFLGLGLIGIWLGAIYDAALEKLPDPDKESSQWAKAWRHFARNHLAVAGLICVVFFYIVAILAPILASHDPNIPEDVLKTRYLSLSADHFLGTDKFGRDIFSRLVYGSRISLSVGFIAVSISIVVGMWVGTVAGYFGGKVDAFLMRFVDILLAFPRLFLVLALVAVYSNSLWLTMAVLGLTGWMSTSRIVRGEVLKIKHEDFITAARALGMTDSRIIFRHILPNILAPVIIVATLGVGNIILTESFLSYLGLSVQPPTPTWGSIINDGQDNLIGAWWITTFPGLAIVLTVLAYNLIGDGLRDALDPRLRDDF